MMEKYRFKTEKGVIGGHIDTAWINDDEDVMEGVIAQVIDNLGTELEITISGVTMHLAGWQDPEHWSEEWQEHCGDQEPAEYVGELLAQAKEEQ